MLILSELVLGIKALGALPAALYCVGSGREVLV
jgi:hypothetical protein